jgi:hypothetical protein
MKAWILPHRRDMTKEEEAEFARISNRAQGFYVYREGRLIQDGGWMDVFGAPEPHTSLLRIEFDFGHQLDEAFRIDVKKSRILFHPDLEDGLRKLLQPVYREAGARYRRESRDDANQKKTVDHSSANKNIAGTPNTTKPQVTAALRSGSRRQSRISSALTAFTSKRLQRSQTAISGSPLTAAREARTMCRAFSSTSTMTSIRRSISAPPPAAWSDPARGCWHKAAG